MKVVCFCDISHTRHRSKPLRTLSNDLYSRTPPSIRSTCHQILLHHKKDGFLQALNEQYNFVNLTMHVEAWNGIISFSDNRLKVTDSRKFNTSVY